MNRKKILYIINHIDWFWSHRLPLALAAKESGWDVHVAVTGAKDPRFQQYGFTAHELSAPAPRIPWDICRLVCRIKPDLIHAITLKYAVFTGLGSWCRTNTPRIYTVAGLGWLFSGEGIKPKLFRLFGYPLLKISFRNARVIVQNPEDGALLVRRGIIKNFTLIRGSGVDTVQFSPKTDTETLPPLVLMSARLLPEKGVAVFIEAARILKKRGIDARFQIAGPLAPYNPNALTEQDMKNLTKDGNVAWLGKMDHMPTLYATATLVVYPSWYGEGIPKVLLEAAACGKAIITTDHPGCREAVRDGENGLLVPVRDAQATADAIEKLLKDPERRKNMGEKSRARAEAEFEIGRIVQETLKLYSF